MSLALPTRLRTAWLPVAIAASVSFMSLSLQIVLLRIFSIVLWHHFAAPLISLALVGNVLGLAAASRKRGILTKPSTAFLVLGVAHFTIWCSLGLTRYSPFLAFTEGGLEAVFPLILLLSQVLFVFSLIGLLLGNAVRVAGTELSLVYAFDLFGGFLGVLALLLLGSFISPFEMLPTQGVLCIAIATIFEVALMKGSEQGNRRRVVACVAFLAVGVVSLLGNRLDLKFPEGKALYRSEEFIEQTVWDPAGRIDILQPTQGIYHGMGGVADPKASDEFSYRLLTQDGGAPSAIVGASDLNIQSTLWRDYLQSASFVLKPEPSTLIIGPGGGLEVVLASHFEARSIEAVELNGGLVSLLNRDYAEYQGGLFQSNNVDLIWSEGRRYLRNSTAFYDVVLLAGVDTFLSSPGGANALAERYLYTVEAVSDSLDRLSSTGVISMVRRKTSPATETLRYLTTAVNVLEERDGPAPKDCIVLIEGPTKVGQATWVNCLIKPSGFSSREENTLVSWARSAGFSLLFRPGGKFQNIYSEYLLASPAKRKSMRASSEVDINPCTDDAPFFFLWAKRSSVVSDFKGWVWGGNSLKGGLLIESIPIGILSCFFLVSTLFLLGLPYFIWVVLPFRAHKVRSSRWGLLYFSSTGFAFLSCEISLFHLAEYISGTPTFSFVTSVGGILLGGGLGSLLCPRNKWLPFAGGILLLCEYFLWKSHLHWESAFAGLAFVFIIAVASGFIFGALYPLGVRVFTRPNNYSLRAVFLGVSSWASVVAGSMSAFIVWYWGIGSLFLLSSQFLFVTVIASWAGGRRGRVL